MIKIGEFSKLAQVPVATLRYYDQVGLLKPVAVDRFTGYRYYSVSQLPRLHRILALKGAKVIFAPHFNYIGKQGLIGHFMKVRADHTARAVENSVYFVRGNNVSLGKEECITRNEGVGYGDSYIVDPHGEIVVRSRRHLEDFIFADIDGAITDRAWKVGRSLWSAREFGPMLLEAAKENGR